MKSANLENDIIITAAEIFKLIENKDTSANYRTLQTKLAALVWQWAQQKFGRKADNAGLEIMQCINRSFTSYCVESGSYVKYLFSALKKEINKAWRKARQIEKCSIRIPDPQQRKIKYIMRIAEQMGKNINALNTQKTIADMTGYPVEMIRTLLNYDNISQINDDLMINNQNKDISLWEVINCSPYETVEETLLQQEKIERYISIIEKAFILEKEKTQKQLCAKKYLGALLTYEVLYELTANNIGEMSYIIDKLKYTSFFDVTIANLFSAQKDFVQQDVAQLYRKDKSDASRKLKKIIQKLCQLIEE